MDPAPHTPGRGEYVPPFEGRLLHGERERPAMVQGGKPTLVLFFGTARDPRCADALTLVAANRGVFDDLGAAFYGVTADPSDEREGRIAPMLPGIRFWLDYDLAISRGLDLVDPDRGYAPCWLLLDPMRRVAGHFLLTEGAEAIAALKALVVRAAPPCAPVLVLPDVIEPGLCRELIALHAQAGGGTPSGVMRDLGGKTRHVLDGVAKVRRDIAVEDGPLANALMARLVQRVAPMARRAFGFEMSHVERLLIGCYDAAEGGHFRAHRDNTTVGTAHRRFAVTINLNPDAYDGGDLVFPEFGPHRYRATEGGAIVFSCDLLHQVTPVTRGRRYALLPFLFDAAGAVVRARNLDRIDEDPVAADLLR